ncbi:hypothetical protein HA075_21670 [bacterium BFN5]|nr:hypothetical protein HA075_21670 [bacterium BFN5]
MKFHGTMRINAAGHLEMGGCDTVQIAKKFGTPLYVFDEEKIRSNCRQYVQSFRKYYPNSEVIYASKVFINLAMCRLIADENMGIDVVSGGELFTAVCAGFPRNRIYFHGNNKTPNELLMAIKEQVGCIVVELSLVRSSIIKSVTLICQLVMAAKNLVLSCRNAAALRRP